MPGFQEAKLTGIFLVVAGLLVYAGVAYYVCWADRAFMNEAVYGHYATLSWIVLASALTGATSFVGSYVYLSAAATEARC